MVLLVKLIFFILPVVVACFAASYIDKGKPTSDNLEQAAFFLRSSNFECIWKVLALLAFCPQALLALGTLFGWGDRNVAKSIFFDYFYIVGIFSIPYSFIFQCLLLPIRIGKSDFIYRIDVWLYLFSPLVLFFYGTLIWLFSLFSASFLSSFFLLLTLLKVYKERNPRKEMQTPQQPKSINSISDLFQAILEHKTEEVKTLLDTDLSQINIPYAANGNTPLHVAVWNGHKDIVELLLAQPAIDTQLKNKDGKTALDLAQEKNLTEIVNLLQNR